MSMVLEKCGHVVALADPFRPDVILMDIGCPG